MTFKSHHIAILYTHSYNTHRIQQIECGCNYGDIIMTSYQHVYQRSTKHFKQILYVQELYCTCTSVYMCVTCTTHKLQYDFNS